MCTLMQSRTCIRHCILNNNIHVQCKLNFIEYDRTIIKTLNLYTLRLNRTC